MASSCFWFDRSLDYPVTHFVVVVGQDVANGRNVIAYQVKHMLEYPQDNVGESADKRAAEHTSALSQPLQPAAGAC
jgi:hypothetical protein